MPDPTPSVTVLNAGRVARLAAELVSAENESFDMWRDYDDDDRNALLRCIRQQLLFLLTSPTWVPGSLHAGTGDQIHVNFVIQPDDLHLATPFGEREVEQMRGRLVALAEHLGGTTDQP